MKNSIRYGFKKIHNAQIRAEIGDCAESRQRFISPAVILYPSTLKSKLKMEQRVIKFRAWDSFYKKMIYNPTISDGTDGGETAAVDVNNAINCLDGVLMQYTGLKDKAGVEIYEHDIVRYYTTERFIQQSHPDINPEIDTCVIRENKDTVVFNDGAFRVKDLAFDYIGQENIDQIKECCGCVDDETCDINGNEINDSILGIEVIGNIYSNPELLTS